MEHSMNQILNILNKIKKKRAIVVGDILLDEYIYGMVRKVSTGIQIPVVDKENVEYRLGGAANVAGNIAGLCKNTALVGRCANDDAGNMVRKLCESYGIKLYCSLSDKTTVKERIYIDSQQVSRLDTNSYTGSVADKLLSIFSEFRADVVIIADYLYGVVSQEVIDYATEYCKKENIPLLLTSRELNKFNVDTYPVIVVNQKEWQQWGKSDFCKEAFVTNGKWGIRYIFKTKTIEKKANRKYPVNVSGAGDTVLAVISLLYGEKITIEDLICVANLAGELAVVDELTYVLKQCDLVNALYEQWINEDCTNKIVDISLASDIVSAWKEEGKKIVFTNGCYDLLHLGHMRTFQCSKKFGDKLVVAVNSDASIKRLKGEKRPINNLKERAGILSYLNIIDMIIPFEEDTAVSVMIKIEPDTYVKGEEYKQKKILETDYAKKVEYVPMLEGMSTTQLIKKMVRAVEKNE